MRIHLVKKRRIDEYTQIHRLSTKSFNHWTNQLKRANWNDPQDIISTFNSADLLGAGTNRVVFNIGGNSYRLICKYFFGKTRVHLFIRWIGTHAEYTKLCKSGKQYVV